MPPLRDFMIDRREFCVAGGVAIFASLAWPGRSQASAHLTLAQIKELIR